jgi:hypothetical protein
MVPSFGDIESYWIPDLTDPVLMAAAPGKTISDIYKVLAYFDNKNLAAFVQCPVYMQVGGIDPYSLPKNCFAVYNNLSVPRKYSIYPDSGHQLTAEANVDRFHWIREMFGLDSSNGFTLQPQCDVANPGVRVTLSAVFDSALPASYQWAKDGNPINGATQTTLTIASVTSSDAGQYTLTATASGGSVTSQPATLSVGTDATSKITNLSIRSVAGHNGNPLIAGFIVTGGSKSVLIRGIGPDLVNFGVTGPLADPKLAIHENTDSGDTVDATNDNWGDGGQDSALSSVFEKVGAALLPDPASKDAAILWNVTGARTIHINSAVSGQSGVVLAEVFDADPNGPARLFNVSARNYVGSGQSTMIAGFIVAGNAPKKLLIRVLGPGLLDFGVTDVLSDPKVEIHHTVNGMDTIVASNDDWNNFPGVQDAIEQLQLLPLRQGSLDSSVVVTVPPGAYTAVVSGNSGATGEALIEVYEVTP